MVEPFTLPRSGKKLQPAGAMVGHGTRLKSIRPCTYVTFPGYDTTLRFFMATATKNKYRCMQCEMTEDRCACEKYCCLCESMLEVRLCQDGLYYCEPCREACDYKTAD